MAKSWYLPLSPLLSVCEGVQTKSCRSSGFLPVYNVCCLGLFCTCNLKKCSWPTIFVHRLTPLWVFSLHSSSSSCSNCCFYVYLYETGHFKQFPRDSGVKRWNYFCSWQSCVYRLSKELHEERNHSKEALGKVLPKDLQSCRGIIHLPLPCLPPVLFPSIFQVLPAGQGSWSFPSAQHQSIGSCSAREM